MNLKQYFDMTDDTQQALGKRLNPPVTQGAVSQWLADGGRVPAERCLDVERATQGLVSRFELRPDIYGKAQVREASA